MALVIDASALSEYLVGTTRGVAVAARLTRDSDCHVPHLAIVFDDEGGAWFRSLMDTALSPRRGGPRFVAEGEKKAADAIVFQRFQRIERLDVQRMRYLGDLFADASLAKDLASTPEPTLRKSSTPPSTPSPKDRSKPPRS